MSGAARRGEAGRALAFFAFLCAPVNFILGLAWVGFGHVLGMWTLGAFAAMSLVAAGLCVAALARGAGIGLAGAALAVNEILVAVVWVVAVVR